MDDKEIVDAMNAPLPDEPAETTPEPEKAEDGKDADAKPAEPEKPDDEPKDPEGEEPEGEEEEPGDEGDSEDGDKPKRRRRPSRTQRTISRLQAEVDALKDVLRESGQKPAPDTPTAPPKPEEFEDYEEYLVARAEYKIDQKMQAAEAARKEADRRRERENRARTIIEKRETMFDAGVSAHPDFQDVFHDAVPVSPAMAEVILESEVGHDLAYYLGKHEDEARKIAGMNPLVAARELGRIEAKLTAPKARKETGAPRPPRTVGRSESPDRDPGKMTYEEYVSARESGKLR